jgi:anthranilate phosphoribosyltransferase
MFKEILNKIVTGENLNEKEAYETMNEIMQGITTPAQIASFLTALRVKGETVEEITGCARAMRENAVSLKETYPLAVDTCGTGGDTKGTFNISTVAAFVVAGTGIMVAKHGNRGVSSKSGSADVLEALGINIILTPSQVEECLQKLGIAFFFAPVFHPAMKHAIGPRREIGFRTIFNLLGPLTNPAGVKRQILGVYDPDITELIAGVLKRLGAQNAMVVCGGLCRYELKDIKGGDAKVNAEITLNILRGKDGPQRLIVIINAAAALIVGGMAKDMRDGIEIAAETIDSGTALKKLESLREYTKRLI